MGPEGASTRPRCRLCRLLGIPVLLCRSRAMPLCQNERCVVSLEGRKGEPVNAVGEEGS
jgi:hypothetical protein